MRGKTTILAAFVASWVLAAVPAPAIAQTPDPVEQEAEDDRPFDRACMDDYGRDLCDEDIWTEIVSKFRLEPAELVQRQGKRGVRVFTVNGYSNDMPAISILATRFDESGEPEDAELEVLRERFPDEYKAMPPSLKREAWSNLYGWAADLQELVAASPERQPDEESEREAETGDRIVSICLHAWVTVTESLTDEGVRRRIRNACGSDPVFEASFAMSGRALLGFPHCNHLDPANHRNESTQLSRCFSLVGSNKIAAADVASIFDSAIEDVADLKTYLAPDVRLTRPGRTPVSGASGVIATLADPGFAEFDLNAGLLLGEADRVIATGWLDRNIEGGFEAADLEISWRKTNNTWRIASINVGPLKTEKW